MNKYTSLGITSGVMGYRIRRAHWCGIKIKKHKGVRICMSVYDSKLLLKVRLQPLEEYAQTHKWSVVVLVVA